MKRLVLIAVLAGLLYPAGLVAQQFQYPETPTVEVIDDYHGVKVLDRFQWLETDVRESEEVADWVTAQNDVTFGYLESLPHRTEIEERLTTLWNYAKFGTPFKVADKYYFTKNDGLQNQNVLYRMDTLDAEPVMVLDPNTWSDDGTIALGGLSFSDDGRYMAYGIQDGGSDWRNWRIMDTESGDLLDDELNWLKFGGITWLPDNSGFYYSRFPAPEEGEEFQSTNLNNKVYFHALNTSQDDDVLIHEDPENPEWGFRPQVSEDGDYLLINVWKGTDDRNQFYYKSLTETDAELVRMIDDFENEYSY
ncbi:MAG: S9 family peptidase, partial [Pirellulaceae bacterium]